METFVNKVANSGIITINLEDYLPQQIRIFDIKDFLFMGLILKEKDFRAALLEHDWEQYRDYDVILTCSADAIIPVWAYMLLATNLQSMAKSIVMGSETEGRKQLLLQQIRSIDATPFRDQRVVIKGCGEVPIPDEAYAAITFQLKPYVKSIMYGEPCSTVPVYKKKNVESKLSI